jgi:hypothetical protein
MSRRRRAEISVSTALAARAQDVWERAVTPEGINYELRPLMRMTVPRNLEGGIDPTTIELGKPIGRSWILLGGVIPFDCDEITVVRLDPGRGFLERSRMLSQKLWEHERTLEEEAGGCRITDRVAWEPRLPIPADWLRPLFERVFRHRHARLRRRFGAAVSPGGRG